MKKIALIVSSALVSQAALADNSNIQSVLDAFTNCDSSFFYQLKNNTQDFEAITDLIIKDNIAYIPVESISSPEGNYTLFKQPIEYRGLNVVGYQNIYIETPFLGQYYYWGLIIDGTIDQVKQNLKQLPWTQYNVASYIANPKLYDRQNQDKVWVNNPYAIDDVIPRSFTVENSIYLEPINETQVHLVCSIQGDMDRPLLYSIRPDMKFIDEELDAIKEAKIKAYKEKKQQELERQKQQQTENESDNKATEVQVSEEI